MSMEALGRLFNVVPAAAGVPIDLRDASGVSFVLAGADTFTVQEATAEDGTGAQDLDVVAHYYTNTADDGGAAWARATQAADAAVTLAAGVAVVEVHAESLSDGFRWIACEAADAGTVVAIVHGLRVQRAPQNLRRLAAV